MTPQEYQQAKKKFEDASKNFMKFAKGDLDLTDPVQAAAANDYHKAHQAWVDAQREMRYQKPA